MRMGVKRHQRRHRSKRDGNKTRIMRVKQVRTEWDCGGSTPYRNIHYSTGVMEGQKMCLSFVVSQLKHITLSATACVLCSAFQCPSKLWPCVSNRPTTTVFWERADLAGTIYQIHSLSDYVTSPKPNLTVHNQLTSTRGVEGQQPTLFVAKSKGIPPTRSVDWLTVEPV